MNQIHSMALALAICGGIATYGFMAFGGSLSVWAAFVAWAAFFHAGGTMEAAKTTSAASLLGVVMGGITMYLITGTAIGSIITVPVWAGIVVFGCAGLAVLAGQIPMLSLVPVTMQGLACMAAFVILNGTGGEKLVSFSIAENAFLNIGISMLIGVACGMATAKLAGLFSHQEEAA